VPPPPAETAADLVRRHALTAADLVIEVGSGEGTLLRAVRACGPRVLGIEADARAVGRAYHSGVDTLAAVFAPGVAEYVRRRYGPARVLLARPPAAGVPADLLAAARVCLGPGGAVVLLHDAAFAEVRPVPLARAA